MDKGTENFTELFNYLKEISNNEIYKKYFKFELDTDSNSTIPVYIWFNTNIKIIQKYVETTDYVIKLHRENHYIEIPEFKWKENLNYFELFNIRTKCPYYTSIVPVSKIFINLMDKESIETIKNNITKQFDNLTKNIKFLEDNIEKQFNEYSKKMYDLELEYRKYEQILNEKINLYQDLREL